MQRVLRVITLQGALKKSPILLSQYWKNESNSTIIISHFSGTNIFYSCIFIRTFILSQFWIICTVSMYTMIIQFLSLLFCLLGSAKGSCYIAAEPNSTWRTANQLEFSNITTFEDCFGLFADNLDSLGITFQVVNSSY